MIDPLVPLALSMRRKPGLYAFLLGSGISSAAGILTGWEVMIDLIQQIAAPEQLQPDEAFGWYKKTFGEDPGYSQLLDKLTHSPEERQSILQGYFEPTEADRKQGRKVPTGAHRALARLMADGYTRIILTTNFDHLLEQAMSEIGVEPLVISSPDAIDGMIPLPHVEKCIIKLNGDYLDCRMKNTPDELANYDFRVEGLLSRVFEEFGLVVCGWSGEWDTALRACLERTKNRRFTTYWTYRGNAPKGVAAQLIEQRGAEPICVTDADSFMGNLSESMSAVANALPRDPIDIERARVLVKKYSSEERFRVDLHELVTREAQWVRAQTQSGFDVNAPYSDEELIRRVGAYEAILEKLRAMMAIGCHWGPSDNASVWTRCLEILGEGTLSGSGNAVWLKLQRYPMLLALYAGGIAAAVSGHFYAIKALLRDALIEDTGHHVHPVSAKVYVDAVVQKPVAECLPGMERHYRPLNDHLSALNEDLRVIFGISKARYDMAFDRFEYLLGLTYVDIEDKKEPFPLWGPLGCFGWRWKSGNEWNVMSQTDDELDKQGLSWGPIAQGLLSGDLPRIIELKKQYDTFVRSATHSWG